MRLCFLEAPLAHRAPWFCVPLTMTQSRREEAPAPGASDKSGANFPAVQDPAVITVTLLRCAVSSACPAPEVRPWPPAPLRHALPQGKGVPQHRKRQDGNRCKHDCAHLRLQGAPGRDVSIEGDAKSKRDWREDNKNRTDFKKFGIVLTAECKTVQRRGGHQQDHRESDTAQSRGVRGLGR